MNLLLVLFLSDIKKQKNTCMLIVMSIKNASEFGEV